MNKESSYFNSGICAWFRVVPFSSPFPLRSKKRYYICLFISSIDPFRRLILYFRVIEQYCLKTVRTIFVRNKILFPNSFAVKTSWFIYIIMRNHHLKKNANQNWITTMIRSSHQRCSIKKVFLEILQNSREDTCARVSFLIKPGPATLLKRRLWHRSFPVNFAKFLKTPFLQRTPLVAASEWYSTIGNVRIPLYS